MSQRWTNTENEFVKQNSSKLTDEQMARAYKMKFQRPIILLQNALSEKYNEMEQTRKLLKEQERALCLLLKDKSHV